MNYEKENGRDCVLPRFPSDTTHSWRSAIIGSTRDARRAGPKLATSAALSRMAAATASARGSFGFMSNRNDSMSRAEAMAVGTLIASPMTTSTQTSRNTIQMTLPRRAPSAIRIPISLVRRATVYASVA